MCQQIKLSIKNFGPIKEGSFLIDKYTVLIGGQGTGKSTVAKLFSLFTWLEKALVRRIYTGKQLQQGNFKNKNFNEYHRIANYYRAETELEYDGVHYQFVYANEKLKVIPKDKQGVEVVKVMYIPAERNILSAVDKPSSIKGLPEPLSAFLEELEQSKLKLKTMTLPLHTGVRFEYDRLNDISWVVGTDYKVRLTEASSGYQSLVPMCLVTACLSDMVADTAKSDLNVSDKMKLQKEVNEVMANSRLSEDVKNAMLQNISARFKYSGFVNVVEEMEQNLYPLSQKDVLYFLLSQCNRMEANRLMLTTHSPYILNYLALSTKAHALWQIMPHNSKALRTRLAEIVPEIACVDIEKLTVYELWEDGTSRRLRHIGDIPTDDNFLNNLLGETNDWFNDLLDLEEQCQA